MIKHGTTLITMGEGKVLMRIGLNKDDEGLFFMYGTNHSMPIGGGVRPFQEVDIPPDIDLEAPDVVIRVTNVAGIDAMIETLQALKETIIKEATDVNKHMNTCLICGAEIPEGRQVCPICEKNGGKKDE